MAGRAVFRTLLVDTAGNTAAAGTTTTLTNTDGTALTGSLYAAASGGSPLGTTSVACDARGRVEVYREAAGRMKATYNGVTVTDDFWPDSEDIITYTRATADGIVAQLRDKGGWTFHLESFAASTDKSAIRGYTPSEDPAVAWAAAAAAVAFVGGGTIVLGPYDYLAPTATTTITSNTTIRGAGQGATIVWHRANTNRCVFQIATDGSANNVTIADMTIDGNLSNNIEYDNSEVSLEAAGPDTTSDNKLINVEIRNWNKTAAAIGGIRNCVIDCHINGPATVSYPNITTYPLRYSGNVGLLTSGVTISKDILVVGSTFNGMRSAAIEVGGVGAVIASCTLRDNHRGEDPAGTPGSQIAPCRTYRTTSLDQPPTDILMVGLTIEETTVGTWSNGIELDGVQGGMVIGCTINNQTNVGIKIAASGSDDCYDILVSGCRINSINTTDAVVGSSGSVAVAILKTGSPAIYGVTLRDIQVRDCANVLWTYGALGSYSLQGWTLTNNTRGWTRDATDTTANWQSSGHLHVSGSHAPLPNRVYQNYADAAATDLSTWGQVIYNVGVGSTGSATGNGLRVQGGTLATDYHYRGLNAAGSADLFDIFGDGTSRHRTAVTTGALSVDVTQGAAGQYKHLLGQRNAATIWGVGSNASDSFVVWDSTLANQNLIVSNAGVVTPRVQLVIPLGSAGTPSLVVTGTASGLYSNGSGDIDVSSGGANSLRVTAAGLVDFRTAAATVALGGGAAPTVGTIGGSGPATAGQNSWLKVKIGGTDSYIPVWR